jgi:hypothetical protein
MSPPFWTGYLVWIGWIAVACGSKNINKRWFWLASAIWNAGLLWLFLHDTEWGGKDKALIYWHARLHLLMAVFASVYLFFSLPPSTKSKTALNKG